MTTTQLVTQSRRGLLASMGITSWSKPQPGRLCLHLTSGIWIDPATLDGAHGNGPLPNPKWLSSLFQAAGAIKRLKRERRKLRLSGVCRSLPSTSSCGSTSLASDDASVVASISTRRGVAPVVGRRSVAPSQRLGGDAERTTAGAYAPLSEAGGAEPCSLVQTGNNLQDEQWRTAPLPNDPPARRPGDYVEATPGQSVICITGEKCKRHVCPCCRQAIGADVQTALRDRIIELQKQHGVSGDTYMLTFTINPDLYDGPREAWEDITKSSRIARTLSYYKDRYPYWFWVLEWHKSGWPHWHVGIWSPKRVYIPNHQIQRKWGKGFVQYTSGEGMKPEQLARYLTKYLTKVSETPAPEWVMPLSYVRMINSSRAWGPTRTFRAQRQVELVQPDDPANEPAEGSASAEPGPDVRPNFEAIEQCCNTCSVLENYIDDNGESRYRYLGVLAVPTGRQGAKVRPSFRAAQRMIRRNAEGTANIGRGSIRLSQHDAYWRCLLERQCVQ